MTDTLIWIGFCLVPFGMAAFYWCEWKIQNRGS